MTHIQKENRTLETKKKNSDKNFPYKFNCRLDVNERRIRLTENNLKQKFLF